MPRCSTIPTLYDECKTISITFLRKHGYLEPAQYLSGQIYWSRNGQKIGSIGFNVNTIIKPAYFELDYRINEKPINYKINLVSIPSNIGKGAIWYFICPQTNKHCRKLYLIGERFLHREAFQGCMYEKQTYSHKNRDLYKIYEQAFGDETAYEQIYKKHIKKRYNGKPTKRYLKLMQLLKASNCFTLKQKEKLLSF